MDSLIRNLVELARSDEALPTSAITVDSISEIARSYAEAFRPHAEDEEKIWLQRSCLH